MGHFYSHLSTRENFLKGVMGFVSGDFGPWGWCELGGHASSTRVGGWGRVQGSKRTDSGVSVCVPVGGDGYWGFLSVLGQLGPSIKGASKDQCYPLPVLAG